MNKQYILMTTNDLKKLLALVENPTLRAYEVIDSEDNTDGEDKWHCDVNFYVNKEDADADNPAEAFSFDSAQTLGELIEARVNTQYLLDHPASSIDFHNIQYWATRLNELRGKLQNEN